MRNQYKTLVGKPKGKRSLGRPCHRWRDNKVDLKELGYEDVDWTHVVQHKISDRLF